MSLKMKLKGEKCEETEKHHWTYLVLAYLPVDTLALHKLNLAKLK